MTPKDIKKIINDAEKFANEDVKLEGKDEACNKLESERGQGRRRRAEQVLFVLFYLLLLRLLIIILLFFRLLIFLLPRSSSAERRSPSYRSTSPRARASWSPEAR